MSDHSIVDPADVRNLLDDLRAFVERYDTRESDAAAPMLPAELAEIAGAIYGNPGWKGKLARRLGLSELPRQWLANPDRPLPVMAALAIRHLRDNPDGRFVKPRK